MYAPFFGLKHEPFSIAPDPRYLFMSERHREALAHLLYGVNGGGGFVLLSGEIGAGKTTVCRCFLEQIPRRCNVAYIFNPKLTVLELLESVCQEFGIPHPEVGHGEMRATVKDYLDPINNFLLKTHAVGQNNVLIIDEAQMLSADVLEQLRLLTNLETNDRKLLQIILIGQPELRDMLARPELEQLAQRVIARYHLGAMTETETEAYIRHRLAVAGMTTAMPFDAKAIARIHQLSRGVPRRINLLCDRALLGAYAGGKGVADRRIVDQAAAEVFGSHVDDSPAGRRFGVPAWMAMSALGVLALVGVIALQLGGMLRSPGTVATSAQAASAASAAPAASASSSGVALAAASVPGPAAAGSAVSASAAASAASAATFLTAADLPNRFQSLSRNENDAWRELANEWKVKLDDGDPCAAALRVQLQCFRSPSSNLALIRQLDRPGILVLRDANDKPVYALLTGLTEQTATLRVAGVSQTISLVSLARLWRGDFATLWRSPPGYTGKTIDAGSGPTAAWLATQLAGLRGQPPSAEATGEAAWRASVSSFQLAQGLKPDGLAGPTTFMQLNRASGVDEPRLTSR
jgi:general secretion pathway protein A